MDLADKLEQHSPTATIGFIVVFLAAYTAQMLATGSLSQDAGFQAVTLVTDTLDAGAVLFTWVLHSTHSHVQANIVVFFLAGWVVESRIARDRFIYGIVFLLGIGVNLAYLTLFGGAGVGISGITAGLVTMIALGSLEALSKFDSQALIYLLICVFSTSYILHSIEVVGQLPPGTAVEAHILGSIFAAAWYATERHYHDVEYTIN